MKINIIYQGKFQEQADKIESGSIDLILTDPPYGTINGIGDNENIEHGMKGKTEWDNMISPKKIYNCANRILRKNGKLILFSQQPYTTILIDRQIANLPHSYNMIWYKDHFANSLVAKNAPVNYYEDVLVFRKRNPKYDFNYEHPLRDYFKKIQEFIDKTKTNIMEKIGQKADHTFRYNSLQFSLCTKKTYQELIRVFNVDKIEAFKPYEELNQIAENFRKNLNQKLNKKYPSIFNLPDGKKHKSNVLEYAKDYDGYHPTQKPVALLEDLIKTFSNKGDLVVDLTAGSGSTGVAAKNCGRDYIGFEKEEKYVTIARKRIKEVQKELI